MFTCQSVKSELRHSGFPMMQPVSDPEACLKLLSPSGWCVENSYFLSFTLHPPRPPFPAGFGSIMAAFVVTQVPSPIDTRRYDRSYDPKFETHTHTQTQSHEVASLQSCVDVSDRLESFLCCRNDKYQH